MDRELAWFVDRLPLHAEEGSVREQVPEAVLLKALLEGVEEKAAAEGVLALCRRVFVLSGVLDLKALSEGDWAFVSFPAYLFAKSIAQSLSTPNLALVNSAYWKQGVYGDHDVVEQQRGLLSFLENARRAGSPEGMATPIRTVHVAWGVIKLGEDFLLRHREDDHRDVRNWVFPGGRLIPDDCDQNQPSESLLRDLLNPDSQTVQASLLTTLKREAREELGLRYEEDYMAEPYLRVPLFRQVEGAANNHALTAYNIVLFSIRLTEQGKIKLFDRVYDHEGDFIWFSKKHLLEGRPDGESAYIDALRDGYKDRLSTVLSEVPESASIGPVFCPESEAITLPSHADQPMRIGTTGKERDTGIRFSDRQLDLLLVCAWHARGFRFETRESGISLLGDGWIRLETSSLCDIAKSMMRLCEKQGVSLIRMMSNRYIRIDRLPENIFLDEGFFAGEVRSNESRSGIFTLTRLERQSALAKHLEDRRDIRLSSNLYRAVQSIIAGNDPENDLSILANDLARSFRQKWDKESQPMGLRKLFRQVDGYWKQTMVIR